MKKSLLILALMSFIGIAQATDVGLTAGGVTGQNAGGIVGVTVGDHFDKFSVDAGFAQGWQANNTSNRWTLVGGYDVATISDVTITPKIGYAYLNNSSTQNLVPSASAALIGVGVSYPITKEVAAVADYAYQVSGNSNNQGNVLTAGVKYSF